MGDVLEQGERSAAVPVPGRRSTLCVGMATYDDFDGVWFTVQALRVSHPELWDVLSFVVVDNHPEGVVGEALRALELQVPRYRYVPFTGFHGTAVRDLVFREADADVVCCVDSHVLIRPGGLTALLEWFEAHPDSRDLLQGPLWYDDLEDRISTHLTPTWGGGMYGQWDVDPRGLDPEGPPFEIDMQGLGLFACRRDAWPGLDPRLRGFGGEEGYLHEKVRQHGGRVLCHPALRWVHRFPRPSGAPYSNVWEDRVRNYLLAWRDIGWDTDEIEVRFLEHLGGGDTVQALIDRARRQVLHPLAGFDALFCGAGAGAAMLPSADLAWLVEEIDVPGPAAPLQTQALLWSAALREAQRRGHRSFLLLEEACDIDEVALRALDPPGQAWDVLQLGRRSGPDDSPSCATGVRSAAYQVLLRELPESPEQADAFVSRWGSWAGYLDYCCWQGGLQRLVAPVVLEDELVCAVHRPSRADGLHVEETPDGLVVTVHDGRVCELNSTAALVLQLSSGLLTSRQIAVVLADEFGLPAPPLREVETTVDALRELGVLA